MMYRATALIRENGSPSYKRLNIYHRKTLESLCLFPGLVRRTIISISALLPLLSVSLTSQEAVLLGPLHTSIRFVEYSY